MHDHAPHDHHSHDSLRDDPAAGPAAGGHSHVFLGADHDRNARRTWWVIAITATMMVAEIVAGTVYGSMALLADGWHMSTHAGALLIAALSYSYARRQARNPRFTFGTGKLGDLAGFASAMVLGVVALLIGWESLQRLVQPAEIDFGQATLVAVIGLVVNLGCALLLRDGHGHAHAHGHDHGHSHDGDHAHSAGDNNLRAAYLHVLADALTSVLAIAALLAGRIWGWVWLDPAIGILGALIIGRWSLSLLRTTGRVLVDYQAGGSLPQDIRQILESGTDRITDLHVWHLGPGHQGAIVSLQSKAPHPPSWYRQKLRHLRNLSHVTIEVEAV